MKTFLKSYWKDIVMINYEVPKELLLPYLPYGIELDEFEGKYFVSLVGFQFLKSTIFGMPIPVYGSFDEVNLRFYVKRFVNNEIRRGVVFISEIVPNKIVAFLANTLYKEHYSYAKMNSYFSINHHVKNINYNWKKNNTDFFIKATFDNTEMPITKGSHEEFIYEHYYGYTKVNDKETWEYKVNHTQWHTNKILSYELFCDFELFYGSEFGFLISQQPHSVYNAIGSAVSIDWHIHKMKDETN
jgi:uncharacterized protein YqjF (DUF2071 family)